MTRGPRRVFAPAPLTTAAATTAEATPMSSDQHRAIALARLTVVTAVRTMEAAVAALSAAALMSRDRRRAITPARHTTVAEDTGRVLPLAGLLTMVPAGIKLPASTTRAAARTRAGAAMAGSPTLRTGDVHEFVFWCKMMG